MKISGYFFGIFWEIPRIRDFLGLGIFWEIPRIRDFLCFGILIPGIRDFSLFRAFYPRDFRKIPGIRDFWHFLPSGYPGKILYLQDRDFFCFGQ